MRFLLRLIALLIVFFAAMSVVRRLIGAFKPSKRQVRGNAGHLVKDPICGTYVPQESALSSGGAFFCSEECRSKFEASHP